MASPWFTTTTFADGAATAWTDYDILDPKSGQWARSAAAGAPGGLPLVLADGRVLKLTFDEFQPPQAADGSWPVVKAGTLEVSSADGTRWSSRGRSCGSRSRCPGRRLLCRA